jgi:HTH-type transcriptional regulator/antitoxin HigA
MLKPVKTEEQYEEALARVYELMQEDLEKKPAKADELEVLSLLINDYESKHYPMPKANPVEAIKFRLEQMGLDDAELSKILGFRSRKSEILSGQRKLSLAMIRRLHEVLNIPAEVLIAEY